MAEIKDTLLISPNAIKASTEINYNVDDAMTARAIRTAQNTYLREIIGERLLDKLKTLEYNAINSLHPNTDDEESEDYAFLLNTYVKPYLEARTQVEILLPISFNIRNIGAGAGKYDTNIAQTNIQNVNYMRDNYRTLSCDRENRLIEYLEGAKDLYPELGNCPCRAKDNKLGERAANTGLWLGRK